MDVPEEATALLLLNNNIAQPPRRRRSQNARRPAVPPPCVAAPAAVDAAREEPPCLRDHVLPMLNLPADLPPAHFICEKSMKPGDVDVCQRRLFLPGGDDGSLMRRLREILTADELSSAAGQDGSIGAGEESRKRMRTTRGGVLRGLPVKLVNHRAGAAAVAESRLMMLRSTDGATIRGTGYFDFVRRCGIKERDVVEIWAFRGTSASSGCFYECEARCGGGHLHVMVAKKDDRTVCSHCSIPMCSHSHS